MKRLLLYSGGFDSTCLLVDLLANHEDDELELMYFDYNQRNLEEELKRVYYMAERFDLTTTIIPLPEFEHVNNISLNEESEDNNTHYIPMRNLIFVSHALSYAQANNIKEVYFGFILPPEEGGYCDAIKPFITWLNMFTEQEGIKVVAPYISYPKSALKEIFDATDFDRDSFFSCNVPVRNEEGELVPCGICADCEYINEIFEM